MAHAEAGGSLPVPNVQALEHTYEQIPERYITVEESAKEVIGGLDISSAIPVIDLKRLLDPESSKVECAKLGSAFEDWGFFQLINHGVPDEVIRNFKNDITGFFKQPLEEKKVYSMVPGNLEGYGQHFVVSDNQKLDWADLFDLMLRPRDSRDMKFWPSNPPSFSKGGIVFVAIPGHGHGVEPESLQDIFKGQPQSMRMTYYPPCRQADKVMGLSPHTDGTGLTLLLQVNEVQGLQVRKDGKWVAVNAVDGAFIINCGDILEILSNGRYKSVEHRALVHPTKARMSAALFHQPCQDATVGPLPELMKKDGVARYSSISYMDFVKGYFAAKLDGRDHLESLRN
ncbi:hypothetical protein EJB05_23431, partial [Eragrostis curvula]